MSDYGWLITEGSPDIGLDVETGTKGPRDILDSLEALLDNGSGEQFRMYDDDGEWYYTGRIVGEYDGFEPLDDYGMPNAGCTEIKFLSDGKWTTI
jgi:hypothetical protein